MMATVFNALQGMNEYGEDTTYPADRQHPVQGYPKLGVQNMYAPVGRRTPTAYGIALSIGDRFGRIYENPYDTPKIEGVELNFDTGAGAAFGPSGKRPHRRHRSAPGR